MLSGRFFVDTVFIYILGTLAP